MESGWLSDLAFSYLCDIFVVHRALLCTHVFLMSRNLTTIEHVGVSRMQGKRGCWWRGGLGCNRDRINISGGGGGKRWIMASILRLNGRWLRNGTLSGVRQRKRVTGGGWVARMRPTTPLHKLTLKGMEKERMRSRSTAHKKNSPPHSKRETAKLDSKERRRALGDQY